MRKIYTIFAFLTILFVISCKKEIKPTLQETSARTLTPEEFDWEHIDNMPMAPSQTTQIPVPWGSGANKQFPDAFLTDWKRSDGWVLVYNTFSTTLNYDNKYFILYNRYRGLLRGYFWANSSTPIPSRQVVHEIKFNGAVTNTPLAYAIRDVVDFDSLSNVYSEIQPYVTPFSGAWYAAEIPISYIPSMSSLNEAGNRMSWNVYNVNITKIDITGMSTGSLTGNLTTPMPTSASSGSNLIGSMLKGGITAISNDGIAAATGQLKVGANIFSSFTSGLLTGGISTATGVVTSFLSGLFSGSSAERNTITYANLKSSSDFKFTGSLVDNYSLSNPTFVTPGTIGASTTSLFAPLYNKRLGIFAIVGRPTANITQSISYYTWSNIGETDERATDTRSVSFIDGLFFNPSSYSIDFNPDVINSNADGATIKNLKHELLIKGHDNGNFVRTEVTTGIDSATYHVYNPTAEKIPFNIPQDWSAPWNITEGGVRGTIYDFIKYPENYNRLRDRVYLRVSFNVVPNNGTSPVTAIIQTFKVKLNNTPE